MPNFPSFFYKISLTYKVVANKDYKVLSPNFMRLLKKQTVTGWWGQG
jgi:hypothetical protein